MVPRPWPELLGHTVPEAWGVETGFLGCSYGRWPPGGGLASSWLLGPGVRGSTGLTGGRQSVNPAHPQNQGGPGRPPTSRHVTTHRLGTLAPSPWDPWRIT